MYVDLTVVPVAAPDDAPVDRVFGRRVLAVIGKTEGNGGVNDFSRALATRAWTEGLSEPALTVMSGGTEGVLSPHVTVVSEGSTSGNGRLAAGVAQTPRLSVEGLGRREQVDAVAAATLEACRNGGFDPRNAHMVLVKCPLLTTEQIVSARGGAVTDDPYLSMARSRAASSLGVALACGEIGGVEADQGLAGDPSVWSAVASASAGIELDRCLVLAFGSRLDPGGQLNAETVVMHDAIDVEEIVALRDRIRAAGGTIVQVFAKAEASPDGRIRGLRHTMLTDTDLSSTRHARAAVGGLLAGVFGRTSIYVSGGAENQGPPGGGPVTVVWQEPTGGGETRR